VNTVFLHGNNEEEIYMVQPEGFENSGKRRSHMVVEEELVRAPRLYNLTTIPD